MKKVIKCKHCVYYVGGCCYLNSRPSTAQDKCSIGKKRKKKRGIKMSEELDLKTKEYEAYIEKHKQNVIDAYDEIGEALCSLLMVDKDVLEELAKSHDDSKYDSIEFDSYRRSFYPTEDEVKDPSIMDYGWLLHQNRNPHHPEYWYLRDTDGDKALEMPIQYIAEHVLDMRAMSYKFGGTPLDYYTKDGYKKCYNEKTRALLEEVLNKLFGKEEEEN